MAERSARQVAGRVVVGSSVAALVAADALAASGESVRVLAPEKSPGAGFGSIRAGERVLELGVRLLELDYEGAPGSRASTPPLNDYVPGPAGHRPYAALVREFIEELVGPRLVLAARPQMFYDGSLVDDLYFTTDATALRDALDYTTRARIRQEALYCAADAGSPAGMLAPEHAVEFAVSSLEEASLSTQGLTFHSLFMEPMAEKFVAGGSAGVLASLRRKIWLPLFWPQTLAEAAGVRPVRFVPSRPFHTVTGGGAGEIVTALVERLRARGVEIERCAPLTRVTAVDAGRVDLVFTDTDNGAMGERTMRIETRRPVLGLPAQQLFAAAGVDYQADQARTVICWLEVADRDVIELPSLVNVVDADLPAIRVSSGGLARPGHRLLTVELRHDLSEAEIPAAARRSVERLGLLRPGAELTEVRSAAVASFALPNKRNLRRFELAAAELADRQLDIEVVGSGVGFGADALGEQIIQGLRAKEVQDA
jgi:hypothetical protein